MNNLKFNLKSNDYCSDIEYILKHYNDNEIIFDSENGICVFNKEFDLHIVCSDSFETAKAIINKIDICNRVILKNDYEVKAINEKFSFNNKMECWHTIYTKNATKSHITGLTFSDLNKNSLNFILNTYNEEVDKDKILRNDLTSKFIIAKYFDKLAGYIGVHEDGEIGYLYVSPTFRKKGIATALINKMVERFENDNETAFCLIEIHNTNSINLHKKLNSIFAKNVFWLYNN